MLSLTAPSCSSNFTSLFGTTQVLVYIVFTKNPSALFCWHAEGVGQPTELIRQDDIKEKHSPISCFSSLLTTLDRNILNKVIEPPTSVSVSIRVGRVVLRKQRIQMIQRCLSQHPNAQILKLLDGSAMSDAELDERPSNHSVVRFTLGQSQRSTVYSRPIRDGAGGLPWTTEKAR